MKKSYQLLLFLKYFTTGITLPVLSLLLVDKGCTLPQIAILMGIYSLTVFALELPSGILSDMLGRRTVFILSCAMHLASSFMMLFLSGFAALIPPLIVFGAGRAFSTGSLDALMIDDFIDRHGKDELPRATSGLAIIETTGISAGTILGGFLPTLSKNILPGLGKFDLNLIMKCVLFAAVLVMTLVYVKETRQKSSQRPSLKNHLLTSLRFIKSSPMIILIAVSILLSGLFIAPVEAYWQPAYTALLPSENLLFTVGIISFGTFAFAALGSIIAKRFMQSSKKSLSFKYTLARISLFCVFVIFSLQKTVVGFGGVFMLVYFLFAGSNVIESTMLNMQIPNKLRSSMLSFVSLIFQAGCMLSPLFSTFAVAKAGIDVLWLYLGLALILGSVLIGIGLHRTSKKFGYQEDA